MQISLHVIVVLGNYLLQCGAILLKIIRRCSIYLKLQHYLKMHI